MEKSPLRLLNFLPNHYIHRYFKHKHKQLIDVKPMQHCFQTEAADVKQETEVWGWH